MKFTPIRRGGTSIGDAMTYITSDQTFPIEMIELALTEQAVRQHRSAMFVYEEGDVAFRASARDSEYQDLMLALKLANEIFEASRALRKVGN